MTIQVTKNDGSGKSGLFETEPVKALQEDNLEPESRGVSQPRGKKKKLPGRRVEGMASLFTRMESMFWSPSMVRGAGSHPDERGEGQNNTKGERGRCTGQEGCNPKFHYHQTVNEIHSAKLKSGSVST